MNRKQRRANKKKSHDPAYMVRQSDMRDHIDRLLKNDPLVLQAIQEEARRANLAEAKEQEVDVKALFLLVIRRSEGYGRKRLLRIAKTLNELMKDYEECLGDCDRFAMRYQLKEEVGIDVAHLDEEIEKYVAEENARKG